MARTTGSSKVPSKITPERCQISWAHLLLVVVAAWTTHTASAELFDLVRLSSLVNASFASSLAPLNLHGHHVDMWTSAAKQPPVYMSAPKQISSARELHHQLQHPQVDHQIQHQAQAVSQVKAKAASVAATSGDLHTAADHYQRKKPIKIKKIKKTKKVVKKKKKVVKKKVKKVVKKKKVKKYKKVKVVMKAYKPAKHHHHQPQMAGGKFYEYREVPKKGAWKFGYKRGNSKHTIERKEDGHKSHFKTVVKWMAGKGKGHHLFDYNHGDHKKGHQHHYHAAAASAPAKVKPMSPAMPPRKQASKKPAGRS